MKRKNLPAWQQVVLVALRNVPEAENGHDAWDRLNEAERAAVMVYLTEHCGDEAQAKLEETCGMIKHPKWWIWCWCILSLVAFLIIGLALMDRFLDLFGSRFTAYMWLAICPINMYTAWQGNSAGKAQKAWEKHAETYEGTMQMLNDMHRLYTLPREKRMNKGFFIFWLVMELVWIGLLIWEGLK